MLQDESLGFDDFVETGAPFIVEAKAATNDDEARNICKSIWTKLGREIKEQTNDLNKVAEVKIGKTEISTDSLPSDPVQSAETGKKPQKKESKQEKKKKKQQAKAASTQPGKEENKNATSGFLSSRDNARVEDVALTKGQTLDQDEKLRLYSKDINIRGLSICIGNLEILDGAELKLHNGHRYGFIGKNGIGKTTLLRYIAAGKIYQFPARVRTLLVEQEATSNASTSILETVLQSDTGREKLVQRLELLEENPEENCDEISDIYTQLDFMEADKAEARARSILLGLGFSQEKMEMPVSKMSGGWRMRVSLACALFAKPDLLMLDEPTNHLDINAILWLQEWIKSFPNTVIVVSHDRTFLNAVITDIIYFNNKKLRYMAGDYDNWKKRKDEKLLRQQREREEDDKKKREIKESIEKYKQNVRAHNPNGNMNMVRAKKKQLERIDYITIDDVDQSWRTLKDDLWTWQESGIDLADEDPHDPAFKFSFPEPDSLGTTAPIIQLSDISFAYEKGGKPLFSHVTLDVDMNSRICLLGPNGVGKSTLLSIIVGVREPTAGQVYRHRNLKIAYFSQHFVEQMDLTLTPLEYMKKTFPNEKEETLRGHLGSFGVGGKPAVQLISTLSGGQKSRVLFAKLTWHKPHVLVLDEPTNHLDYQTIDGLINAVKNFKGGVVLVSHDQYMISSVQKELYLFSKGTASRFDGEFEDYLGTIKPRL